MTADERLARLEQRVTDVDNRLTQLAPAATKVSVLSERVGTVRDNLQRLSTDFEEFCSKIDQRDAETRRDRRNVRLAIWGMTVTLACALIGAATVLLTSIPHG